MHMMDDYFETLTAEEKAVYSALAEYAFSLGYKAKKDKTKTLSYTFIHPRVKQRILRFSSDKGKPVVKLKFFASQSYTPYFHEAIRTVIEEYNYRYTGCYGCGTCDGTHGYTYKYPDGRQYDRYGTELIDLSGVTEDLLPEIFLLLQKQHQYYLDVLPQE